MVLPACREDLRTGHRALAAAASCARPRSPRGEWRGLVSSACDKRELFCVTRFRAYHPPRKHVTHRNVRLCRSRARSAPLVRRPAFYKITPRIMIYLVPAVHMHGESNNYCIPAGCAADGSQRGARYTLQSVSSVLTTGFVPCLACLRWNADTCLLLPWDDCSGDWIAGCGLQVSLNVFLPR